MKKIIEIIYLAALALFEFIIDLLIILVSSVMVRIVFGDNIYANTIILLIVFCGFVYSVNDTIEVYKENKKK